MRTSVYFVLDRGRFEWQALLLTATIRKLALDQEYSPLIAFIPDDAAAEISDRTTGALKDLGVEFRTFERREPFKRWRFANKLYATALVDTPQAVFLDTDTLLVSPTRFSDWPLPMTLRAVHSHAAAHHGVPSEVWRKLYEKVGVEPPEPNFGSNADQYPYFNAGMVAFDNVGSFRDDWLRVASMIHQDRPESMHANVLDQVALPIAAKAAGLAIANSGMEYNRQIGEKNKGRDFRKGTYLLHYHVGDNLIGSSAADRLSSLLREFYGINSLLDLFSLYDNVGMSKVVKSL